jgi:hypothetical protein
MIPAQRDPRAARAERLKSRDEIRELKRRRQGRGPERHTLHPRHLLETSLDITLKTWLARVLDELGAAVAQVAASSPDGRELSYELQTQPAGRRDDHGRPDLGRGVCDLRQGRRRLRRDRSHDHQYHHHDHQRHDRHCVAPLGPDSQSSDAEDAG